MNPHRSTESEGAPLAGGNPQLVRTKSTIATETGHLEITVTDQQMWIGRMEDPSTCARTARHGFQDLFSAVLVGWRILYQFETSVALLSSLFAVTFFNFWNFGEQEVAAKMSWVFVSVAVVFPLTYEINSAFKRREEALNAFAQVKALIVSTYLGHVYWDWDKDRNGRGSVPSHHSDEVLMEFNKLLRSLNSYLCLPTVTRARHVFTNEGKEERKSQIPVQQVLFRRIYISLRRLNEFVERLKQHGLPANEASRLNQYHCLMIREIERLHNLKEYRTPSGPRSVARLFIHLMPWLYGPYFVWLTHNTGELGAGLFFSYTLCIFTSMVMVGFFNVQGMLEDPFDEEGLDDVKTTCMCREISHAMEVVGPNHRNAGEVEYEIKYENDDFHLGRANLISTPLLEICVP